MPYIDLLSLDASDAPRERKPALRVIDEDTLLDQAVDAVLSIGDKLDAIDARRPAA